MNEDKNQEKHHSMEQPARKKEMSRRQFLSYTLGGTGGFLAAGLLVPMIRFSVDPILESKGKAEWVKVVEESKVTETPKHFNIKKHVVDGWHAFDQELGVFIMKDKQGDIFALSDICTHLGCTVSWASDPEHPKEFACPCHGSHFDVYGKNLIVAPIPLNQFTLKVENGYVYVGNVHPNTEVAKEKEA